MAGWIKLHSRFWNSWQAKQPDTAFAWFWLIAHCAWRDGEVLCRGQVPFSTSWAPRVWGMTKDKAVRFLHDCEASGDIVWGKSKGGRPSQRENRATVATELATVVTTELLDTAWSVITLCNYDKYQGSYCEDATDTATDSLTASATANATPPYRTDKIDCTDKRCTSSPSAPDVAEFIEKKVPRKKPFTRDLKTLEKYLAEIDLDAFHREYDALGVDVDRVFSDFHHCILNGTAKKGIPNPYEYVQPLSNAFKTWCNKRVTVQKPKKKVAWIPPEQRSE